MSSQIAEAERKNSFSGLGFDPTDKELEVFNKEKMQMYKGTFIVCLVYAITAMTLLGIIFWTDWGKEYIYKKMLPASVTFILGALFIIIFLVISIYELKPRRVKNNMEKDEEIVCPDFWVLKRVEEDVKKDFEENNKGTTNTEIIAGIKSKNDAALKYKCELDANVYGDLKTYAEMKNALYDGKTNLYKIGKKYQNRASTDVDYLYIENKNSTNQSTQIPYTDPTLAKYAAFSGIYRTGDVGIGTSSIATLQGNSIIHSDATIDSNNNLNAGSTNALYDERKALICNVVYPQVLAKMDKDTPEQNKYRCEYAKACDIAWTDIGCQYKPPV